jgi:hypothetical protein
VSNSELESSLDRTSALTTSLKEHVIAQAASLAALGKRAFFGTVEAIAGYADRRKLEITLGVGTVAMIGGAGIAGLQGMAVAERQADLAADNLYENIAPEHIVAQQKRAEAMRSGSVTLAAGSGSDKVRMSVTAEEQESIPARAAAGLVGLALAGGGATASVLALRGRSRRTDEEEPVWQVAAPPIPPIINHREGMPDAAVVLDGMFDRPYQPARSEQFDEWCGKTAMNVVRGCRNGALAVTDGLAAGASRFAAWRTGLRERRARQLEASVAAISYDGPVRPTNLAEYEAKQSAAQAWERQAFYAPSNVIADGQSLLLTQH